MLFNSLEFITLFLPCALIGFYALGRRPTLALAFLACASLYFYAQQKSEYALLIVGSILINYFIGSRLTTCPSKRLLIAGITFNLVLISVFKYSGFLVENIALFADHHLVDVATHHTSRIALPLAISFFTFQQIAYLVDVYRDRVQAKGLLRYSVFVLFFPQLIAGPIVHHKEMLPQFEQRHFRPQINNILIGLTIFALGLFKKVVLADGISAHATPTFDLAQQGAAISFYQAWIAAFAYSFQLYFDFSGYSDMAIGLARLFGITLPLNFYSPYKAANIIEFWRRWHITMSRFFRDYLYIPLGGSQHGHMRTMYNLLIVMLLAGLWHGAAWTFVLWGAGHGVALLLNHRWQRCNIVLPRTLGVVLTFFTVTLLWVLFRAESFSAAAAIYAAMFELPSMAAQFDMVSPVVNLFALAIITWSLPNTLQLFAAQQPVLKHALFAPSTLAWRFTPRYALLLAALTCITLLRIITNQTSEFLYFQF